MASFSLIPDSFYFKFDNHSDAEIYYNFGSTTGRYELNGTMSPSSFLEAPEIELPGTIEWGNAYMFEIVGYPAPRIRFWSGFNPNHCQYINLLGENGWTVTKDTSEINEVTGHGFRITVDGGGRNQNTTNIFFQFYNA